jgi:hypothetical protein
MEAGDHMAVETATQRRQRTVDAQSAERKARAYWELPQERAEREFKTGATTLWTLVDANN